MKKILYFIPDRHADFEAVAALHLLHSKCGREIATVGFSKETITAQSGLKHSADYTLEEAAELADIEALIMPGGPIIPRDDRLSEFILSLYKRGVLLAAICFAPQYLARCGLLESHRYTTSCSPEQIRKLGIADPFPRTQYVDERVVTDGNIITAKGYAFLDFAFEITRHLGLYDEHKDEFDSFYRDITNR